MECFPKTNIKWQDGNNISLPVASSVRLLYFHILSTRPGLISLVSTQFEEMCVFIVYFWQGISRIFYMFWKLKRLPILRYLQVCQISLRRAATFSSNPAHRIPADKSTSRSSEDKFLHFDNPLQKSHESQKESFFSIPYKQAMKMIFYWDKSL